MVLKSDITVPTRKFTCRGYLGSSSRTTVGPSCPHTARAMLKSEFVASRAASWLASVNGSSCCRAARVSASEMSSAWARAAFHVPAGVPVTVYEYCNLHGLWKAEG